MAAALLRLARDPDLRRRVGATNARTIELRNGAEPIGTVWATLLADALGARRS